METRLNSRNLLLNRPWARRYFFLAFLLSGWLIQGLSYRQSTLPDGISYLDIADACRQGNWHALINGYWSPAYPFLMGAWFSLFKPPRYWELTHVRVLNSLILLLCLACFEFFLNSLIARLCRTSDGNEATEPLAARDLRIIGYTLCIWISFTWLPPSLAAPDGLVFAIVLLAGGVLLRIASGADSMMNFAALGLLLGLGYLGKSAMFPLAFVFLAVAALAVGDFRRSVPRLLVATLFFLLVSAPFIAALSHCKGRFTIGDTGAIAYAEYVDKVPLCVHWQGNPAGTGTPKHPTREVLASPRVYEYSGPIGGTYPPWSDPSFWYEGIHPHFQLIAQLNSFRHSLDVYEEMISQLGSLFAGLLVLVFYEGSLGAYIQRVFREYFLWVPAVAALGMYSLVLVESRYIAGSAVLLWAALFSPLRIARSDSGLLLGRRVSLAVTLLLGLQIFWLVGHSALRMATFRNPPDPAVAQQLKVEGIMPGDKVAFIGFALADDYWAHLAGTTIVAEVFHDDVPLFWAADASRRAQILHLFAQAGAKAVLARALPFGLATDGWENVPGTDYYILKNLP